MKNHNISWLVVKNIIENIIENIIGITTMICLLVLLSFYAAVLADDSPFKCLQNYYEMALGANFSPVRASVVMRIMVWFRIVPNCTLGRILLAFI